MEQVIDAQFDAVHIEISEIARYCWQASATITTWRTDAGLEPDLGAESDNASQPRRHREHSRCVGCTCDLDIVVKNIAAKRVYLEPVALPADFGVDDPIG